MSAQPQSRTKRGGVAAGVELAVLVRGSVATKAKREVLYIRLSLASSMLRLAQHRRMLRDSLEWTLASASAQMFELPNGDLVAVVRQAMPAVTAVEAALRGSLEGSIDHILQRYRLPEEAAQVLTAASEALGLEVDTSSAALLDPTAPPIDSAELEAAERMLSAANLAAMTMAHSVCRLDLDGSAPEPIWEDRRISWPMLAPTVLPGRSLEATPALARRLDRAAEARLLAELARPAARREWRPVGLPLSRSNLEGPALARFVSLVDAPRRAQVILAFRPADVLTDPGLPARLAPALRAQGFRLALDDAAPQLLALLPPERLGVDIIRLRWAPDLPSALPPAITSMIAEEPHRVVLAGVDRLAAIAWGWDAGIRLFQGPLVERRRSSL